MSWLDRLITEESRIRIGSPAAYATAVLATLLALLLRIALAPLFPPTPYVTFAYITFWPAAVFAALIGGLGPGLLATALGGLCGWFWLAGANAPSGNFGATAYTVFSGFNCFIIFAFQEAVRRLRTERVHQQELARTLEQRVAERTAALVDANAKLQEEIARREKSQEQALQAQKLEAVGQLTGGVAHGFNNLLTVIFGNLDAVRLRLGTRDPTSERLIESALRAAERAAGLTERLLAFARRQSLAPTSVDINRLVTDLSDLLRRSAGDTIEFETALAYGLWRALCDPHQLEIALLNLVINARDAMPSGGRLTVETANASLDEAYAERHDQVTPGQYVLVAISDTGAGMTSEIVAHAFEPFFTTKPVGQGTGLGLSMVYGFVKQSGGHVKLYSEPKQGTTVKIYLPRAGAAAADLPQRHDGGSAAGIGVRGTILVVEDDEDVRGYAATVLRRQGYAVLEASNGSAALAVLRSGARIDLLFTDVVMPRMDGPELARAARQLSSDLKIVFTTGYSPHAALHSGRLDPAVALIPKPFTAAALTQRIDEALAS